MSQVLLRLLVPQQLGAAKHALPDTVAKALDGLSPALRLARAAARAAQRGEKPWWM